MSGGTHQVIGNKHLLWNEYKFRICKLYRHINDNNYAQAVDHALNEPKCPPHKLNTSACKCVAMRSFQ